MQRLVLFDIDQTLVSIGSGNLPQRQALNMAFEQVHGIPHAFEDVTFGGGMDLPLMVEVYRKWGLIADGFDGLPDIFAFKAAYFEHLTSLLEAWTAGMVCPGVPALLEALSAAPRVQLGLETGNFMEAAFIKLRRYGLDTYFEDGGFGGDYAERHEVVAGAIARCQERSGRTYSLAEIFVVGGSPSDIEAGNANGIRTLAVATGLYPVADLARFNPSHVLPDLSDTGKVLISCWVASSPALFY
jgi:phosphoglycolate phosphatase-like HAD superfamily hydrolase